MTTIDDMILVHTPAPPGLHIPGRILALSHLSLTARALLADAYARQRRGRGTSLHNDYYARRIGYPLPRIKSALTELEHAGYLVRHYTLLPVRRRLLVFTFPTAPPVGTDTPKKPIRRPG